MNWVSLQTTIVLGLAALSIQESLPVIMIHGLFANPSHFDPIVKSLHDDDPSIACYAMAFADNGASLEMGMMDQVPAAIKAFKEVIANISGPYNILSHSQGSLIARAVIEEVDNHNVHRWVSLAGPNLGEFGIPGPRWINKHFPQCLKEEVHLVWYNEWEQAHVSFAGYWNDPNHRQQYLSNVDFLPHYNNEIQHEDTDRYRSNFLRVREVVLLGSPVDDVIVPWDSSLFNFFTPDSTMVSMDMSSQDIYKRDTFGLRTLNEEGRLLRLALSNVAHIHWLSGESEEAVLAIKRFLLG